MSFPPALGIFYYFYFFNLEEQLYIRLFNVWNFEFNLPQEMTLGFFFYQLRRLRNIHYLLTHPYEMKNNIHTPPVDKYKTMPWVMAIPPLHLPF